MVGGEAADDWRHPGAPSRAEAGLVEERPFRLTAGDAVALPQAVKLFDD